MLSLYFLSIKFLFVNYGLQSCHLDDFIIKPEQSKGLFIPVLLSCEKLLYLLGQHDQIIFLFFHKSVIGLLLLFDLRYLGIDGVQFGVEILYLDIKHLFLLVELSHTLVMVLLKII